MANNPGRNKRKIFDLGPTKEEIVQKRLRSWEASQQQNPSGTSEDPTPGPTQTRRVDFAHPETLGLKIGPPKTRKTRAKPSASDNVPTDQAAVTVSTTGFSSFQEGSRTVAQKKSMKVPEGFAQSSVIAPKGGSGPKTRSARSKFRPSVRLGSPVRETDIESDKDVDKFGDPLPSTQKPVPQRKVRFTPAVDQATRTPPSSLIPPPSTQPPPITGANVGGKSSTYQPASQAIVPQNTVRQSSVEEVPDSQEEQLTIPLDGGHSARAHPNVRDEGALHQRKERSTAPNNPKNADKSEASSSRRPLSPHDPIRSLEAEQEVEQDPHPNAFFDDPSELPTQVTQHNLSSQATEPVVSSGVPGGSNGPEEGENGTSAPQPDETVADDTRVNVHEGAIQIEAARFLLGYAKISLATDDDLGRGPEIQPQNINPRTGLASAVTTFAKFVGFDSSEPEVEPPNLAPHLPENAVAIAVSPSLIAPDSLTQNPHSKQFHALKWMANHRDVRAPAPIRLQGNTRAGFVRKRASSHLKRLLAIDAQLVALSKGTSSSSDRSKAVALTTERRVVLKEIASRTVWLAAVYDLDAIQASPKVHDIMMHLCSNRPAYQRPDSEMASMLLRINHLLLYPKEQQEDQLSRDTIDPNIAVKNRRLHRVLLDNSFFLSIVQFYPYSLHWPDRTITPNSLDRLGPYGRPFMEAIIMRAIKAFDFLCSDQEVEEYEQESQDIDIQSYREALLLHFPAPLAYVLNPGFFNILNNAYERNIRPLLDKLGANAKFGATDVRVFNAAFQNYATDVRECVSLWSEPLVAEAESRGSELVVRTFKHFLNRLALLLRGLLNNCSFGMELTTGFPLLCPMLFSDLLEVFESHKISLETVWCWLDSFANETKSVDHLRGLSTMMKAGIDGYTPTHPSACILNQILSEIFSLRNYALAGMKDRASTVDDSVLRYAIPKTMTASSDWQQAYSACEALLSDWKTRNLTPTVTAIDESTLSATLLENVLGLQHGRALVNSFLRTVSPWWNVGAKRKEACLRRAVKHALTVVWASARQEQAYADAPAIWYLRDRIAEILLERTSFFPGLWDALQSPFDTSALTQHPDSLPYRGRLVLEGQAGAIQQRTHKTIDQISRLLCQELCGAIPVPVNDQHAVYRPHPDVYTKALALFEALEFASYQAQQTYLQPASYERLQIADPLTPRMLLNQLSLPSEFVPAPFERVVSFYKPYDPRSAADLYALGHGRRGWDRRQELHLPTSFSLPTTPRKTSTPASSQAQLDNSPYRSPLSSWPHGRSQSVDPFQAALPSATQSGPEINAFAQTRSHDASQEEEASDEDDIAQGSQGSLPDEPEDTMPQFPFPTQNTPQGDSRLPQTPFAPRRLSRSQRPVSPYTPASQAPISSLEPLPFRNSYLDEEEEEDDEESSEDD